MLIFLKTKHFLNDRLKEKNAFLSMLLSSEKDPWPVVHLFKRKFELKLCIQFRGLTCQRGVIVVLILSMLIDGYPDQQDRYQGVYVIEILYICTKIKLNNQKKKKKKRLIKLQTS